MDDKKQCMSDSFDFPVGKTTQGIQLGRLIFLAHLTFNVKQDSTPSTVISSVSQLCPTPCCNPMD